MQVTALVSHLTVEFLLPFILLFEGAVVVMFLGFDFSGLILEGPFNNFLEEAINHPLSAVCYSRYSMFYDA